MIQKEFIFFGGIIWRYMIIGNGQLAKKFEKYNINEDVCIFASGVSNSGCVKESEFKREKDLLLDTLSKNKSIKFVYFSSCALSAIDYPKNDYYNHKKNMENLIKSNSDNYYIFRVPQLFGDLILHTTLINFIYTSIEHNQKFNVYDEAYRYVIEINDVKTLAESYINYSNSCVTVDLANIHRYKVLDIVKIFEKLLDKKAIYEVMEKEDQYLLDLSSLKSFIKEYHVDINFSEDYLITKLEEKIYPSMN